MIIMQYVRFEQSYDRFHAKADHIYRVILEYTSSSGIKRQVSGNHPPLAEALIEDFSEVLSFVRITPEYDKLVFSHQDKVFEEEKLYFVDPTFFTLFDFKLLAGDPKTALNDVGSLVLSKTTAEKFFGPIDTWQESPLNQIILMNNTQSLKVTGIMEDMPPNSHINANALRTES